MEREEKKRWNKNYIKCRNCGTIDLKHFKEGFCKNCYRDVKEFGGNRELAMDRAGQKCESCGIGRDEYRKNKHHDLIRATYWRQEKSCFRKFKSAML